MDEDLADSLPSRRTAALAAVIGRRLVDICRMRRGDPAQFAAAGPFDASEFFARGIGPAEMQFEGTPPHVLNVWESQMSILVLDPPMAEHPRTTRYCLSSMRPVSPALAACLGQECTDVRIWTSRDSDEYDEAREFAVSYAFANGSEIFYCIFLHGAGDNDYLLLGEEIAARAEAQAHCYSIAQRGPCN